MQILSRVLLFVGLAVVLAAGLLLLKVAFDINQLELVANAYRNVNMNVRNPMTFVTTSTGLGIIGGFLVGLALNMPRRAGRI